MQQCVKYNALFVCVSVCVQAHLNPPAGGCGSSANWGQEIWSWSSREVDWRGEDTGIHRERIKSLGKIYQNIVMQCYYIFILYMLGHHTNRNLNITLRKCLNALWLTHNLQLLSIIIDEIFLKIPILTIIRMVIWYWYFNMCVKNKLFQYLKIITVYFYLNVCFMWSFPEIKYLENIHYPSLFIHCYGSLPCVWGVN